MNDMKSILLKELQRASKKLRDESDSRAKNVYQILVESVEALEAAPWVLISGETNAGKSHLINQLIPEIELPTENMPATALCTVISYGEQLRTFAVDKNKKRTEMTLAKINEYVLQSSREKSAENLQQIDYMELEVPNPLLKTVTLVDTPGLNSTNTAHTQVTESFYPNADAAIWVFSGSSGVNSSTENRDIQKLRSHGIQVLGVVNKMAIAIEASYNDEPERFDALDYMDVQDVLIAEWKQRYEEVGLSDLIGIDSKLAQDAQERSEADFDWADSNFDVFIEKLMEFTLPEQKQQTILKTTIKKLVVLQSDAQQPKLLKLKLQQLEKTLEQPKAFDVLEALQQLLQVCAKPFDPGKGFANYMQQFQREKKLFLTRAKAFDETVYRMGEKQIIAYEEALVKIWRTFEHGLNVVKQRTNRPMHQGVLLEVQQDLQHLYKRRNEQIEQAFLHFKQRANAIVLAAQNESMQQHKKSSAFIQMVKEEQRIVNVLNDVFERINIFATTSTMLLIPKIREFVKVTAEQEQAVDKLKEQVKDFSFSPVQLKLKLDVTAVETVLNTFEKQLIDVQQLEQRIQRLIPGFVPLNKEKDELNEALEHYNQEVHVLNKIATYQSLIQLIKREYIDFDEVFQQVCAHAEVVERVEKRINAYNASVKQVNRYFEETIKLYRFKRVDPNNKAIYIEMVQDVQALALTKQEEEQHNEAIKAIHALWPQMIAALSTFMNNYEQYILEDIQAYNAKSEGYMLRSNQTIQQIQQDTTGLLQAFNYAATNGMNVSRGYFNRLEQEQEKMQNITEQLPELPIDGKKNISALNALNGLFAMVEQLIPFEQHKLESIQHKRIVQPLRRIAAAVVIGILLLSATALLPEKEATEVGWFDKNIVSKIRGYEKVPYVYTGAHKKMPLGYVHLEKPKNIYEEPNGVYLGTSEKGDLSYYTTADNWIEVAGGGWLEKDKQTEMHSYDETYNQIESERKSVAQLRIAEHVQVHTGPGEQFPVVTNVKRNKQINAYTRDEKTGWYEIGPYIWVTNDEKFVDVLE